MTRFIGAIDQGTTSTRFIVFDRSGEIIASAQKEHAQIYPQPGWVEHDPLEIWRNTQAVIAEALRSANLTHRDLAAIGITNQRETTLLWDRAHRRSRCTTRWSGRTRGSIRWSRSYARDGGQDRFRAQTGLPLASYFSALKLRWLLDNVPDARASAEAGDLLFGTIDTWLLWNLTGALHVTDVTNASRTQLMNLATLDWDDDTARRVRHSARRAAADRRRQRGVRRCDARRARRRADRRHPRRPAGGAGRARPASSRARRRTPMAPAASC